MSFRKRKKNKFLDNILKLKTDGHRLEISEQFVKNEKEK